MSSFKFCICVTSLLVATILSFATAARANESAASHQRCRHLHSTTVVILCVFGPRYGPQAVRVARCESTLRTRAHNGQYLGLFQMGSAERLRYGHGSTAFAQATAARLYFVASGRDWSPWSCRWAARRVR